MRQVKKLFMILSCIMFLLIGCTGESVNSFQADINKDKGKENIPSTQQPQENPAPPKQDASEPIDKNVESVTSPEIDYDPELLSYISVQDGFHIADYGKSVGANYSYAVFNMRMEDEAEDKVALYWEIVVMQENNVITVFRVGNEEHGDAFPASSEMVIETDVNFDGNHDILICLGHFGNQGAVSYKCFLSTDVGFVHCPSFTEIPNPSIDYANQVVGGQWRNGASSHGWGIFKFFKNEFIGTERLTEEAVDYNEADELRWTWREDVFLEGKWQTRAYYTEKNIDYKTIQNKLYGPDSYWGLDQSKWNTLFK